MIEFVPRKIGFNAAACQNAILRAADALMSETSDILILIMKKYIDKSGNGSEFMKSDAKKMVHEILHEVAADHINIEAGFDEAMAYGMAKDFFVRVMVVIHGNQAGGNITEKPGMPTFKKNVTNYGMPDPDTRTGREIPQFDQYDVSEGILENTMKEIQKYFDVMIAKLEGVCSASFFAGFVTGG